MARKIYAIEKGLRIFKENSDTEFIDYLFGSAAPGGDTGEQDDAPLGSLYLRQNGASSTMYQKKTNGGSTADWEENGQGGVQIGFRPEKIRAVTGENVSPGVRNLTTTPFTDDDGTTLVATDFAVGEFLIANAGGAAVLLEVTDVSDPNVTFSNPVSAPALAELDTFLTPNYLPDPVGQEAQALIQINASGNAVKVADVDWAIATGISLSGSYTAQNGTVAAGNSVEAAIEKLDGNQQDIQTLQGVAQGSVDLGTFSGVTIPDSSTVKAALQALETAHEEVDQNVNDLITLSGVPENSVDLGAFTGVTIPDNQTVKAALQALETAHESLSGIVTEIDGNVDDLITLSGVPENSTDLGAFTGDLLADGLTNKAAFQRIEDLLDELKMKEAINVTTIASVDEVPVASYSACKWLVHAFEEATPANRKSVEVFAHNDGTTADESLGKILKLGGNFDLSISVDVSGGNMRLRAASTTAGVTVRARRIGVVDI